jgi:hypothetical protein
MKKKIKHDGYEDLDELNGEPIGEIGEPMIDFLPSPEELACAERQVKISININRRSLETFKAAARKTGVKYQRLMRAAVNAYANAWRKKLRKVRV